MISELFKDNNSLMKEIREMKSLKVCMKCQINKDIVKDEMKKHMCEFVDNCLQEDCVICGGKDKKRRKSNFNPVKTGDKVEEEKIVDSWVIWYKVEGMNEAVQQFHLTKEECEIIYGNLTNLTYWNMEVME